MAREVNQVLWAQWRQRMERQRASGLSIVAFCRREGVSKATFHVWKRKLGGILSARPSSREAATVRRPKKQRATVRNRRGLQNPPARSMSTTRSADFLQLPVPSVRSSPWIEVTLVDGTLVRIPQENLTAFATLLKLLRMDNCVSIAGETHRA